MSFSDQEHDDWESESPNTGLKSKAICALVFIEATRKHQVRRISSLYLFPFRFGLRRRDSKLQPHVTTMPILAGKSITQNGLDLMRESIVSPFDENGVNLIIDQKGMKLPGKVTPDEKAFKVLPKSRTRS
jgi:hypothetical protein